MDTAAETAKLNFYADMFARSPNTVILLDRVLKCVHTNNEKLFAQGVSLLPYVKDPLVYPMKEFTEVGVLLNGELYCARIMPQLNELGDTWLYVCELIDGEATLNIAGKTDAAAKVLPLYNSVECNLGVIWRSASELRKKLTEAGDFDDLSEVFRLETALAKIGSVTKNAFEYADMLFSKRDSKLICVSDYVGNMINRCNAALAKCGRRVEFVCDGNMEILADGRHSVVALVNAVQNALLYSPRDCTPIVAVYNSAVGSHSFVNIRITNDKLMFSGKDFKDVDSVNFNYQRLGYGIPIIKRFAEEAGGSFEMTDENDRVVVTLTFPAAPITEDGKLRAKAPSDSYYDIGIPDIVELKMREVVELFGE